MAKAQPDAAPKKPGSWKLSPRESPGRGAKSPGRGVKSPGRGAAPKLGGAAATCTAAATDADAATDAAAADADAAPLPVRRHSSSNIFSSLSFSGGLRRRPSWVEDVSEQVESLKLTLT